MVIPDFFGLIKMENLCWHYTERNTSSMQLKSIIASTRLSFRKSRLMCADILFVVIWLVREWLQKLYSTSWDIQKLALR